MFSQSATVRAPFIILKSSPIPADRDKFDPVIKLFTPVTAKVIRRRTRRFHGSHDHSLLQPRALRDRRRLLHSYNDVNTLGRHPSRRGAPIPQDVKSRSRPVCLIRDGKDRAPFDPRSCTESKFSHPELRNTAVKAFEQMVSPRFVVSVLSGQPYRIHAAVGK